MKRKNNNFDKITVLLMPKSLYSWCQKHCSLNCRNHCTPNCCLQM